MEVPLALARPGAPALKVLLLEHHPMQQRRVAAAVLLRPGDHGQAGVEQHPIPMPMLGKAFGVVVGLRRDRLSVGREEIPYLGLEGQCVFVEF